MFIVSDRFSRFKEFRRDEAVELFVGAILDRKKRRLAYTLLYSSNLGFVYRVARKLAERGRIPSSFRTFFILKVISTPEEELIRETILHRGSLRRLFARMHLPARMFNNKEIANEKWLEFVDILDGKHEIMRLIKQGDIETLIRLRIPAHRALQFVHSDRRGDYFRALARAWPEEFIRHIKLAQRYLSKEEIESLRKSVLEKAKISGDLVSMSKIEHLSEKEVLSIKESYERIREEFGETLKKLSKMGYTIVILIDASGSMSVTSDFISEMKPILAMGGLSIEFRGVARDVTEIVKMGEYEYYAEGSTSITAGFLLALEKLGRIKRKGIFILVSDMGHNTGAEADEYIWEHISKSIRVESDEDKHRLCNDLQELLRRIRMHGHYLVLVPLGWIRRLESFRRLFNVVLKRHEEATRETIRDIYLGLKETIRLIEIRKRELERIRKVRESLIPFRVERGTIERVLLHNLEPPKPLL